MPSLRQCGEASRAKSCSALQAAAKSGLYPKCNRNHCRILSRSMTWSDLYVEKIAGQAVEN